MQWRNTISRFGVIHKSFHWIMAFLVVTLLCVGLYMTGVELPIPQRIQIFSLHKSLGVVVLTLVVLRILWRLASIRPAHLITHAQWERSLATVIHFLLYAAMIAMPLTGWIMSSAKGYPVRVFGLFNLPDLVGTDQGLAKLANAIHEYTAYILIAIIGLHVAGALKHHIIDRDDTLRRMIPFGRIRNDEVSK